MNDIIYEIQSYGGSQTYCGKSRLKEIAERLCEVYYAIADEKTDTHLLSKYDLAIYDAFCIISELADTARELGREPSKYNNDPLSTETPPLDIKIAGKKKK